MFRRGMVLLTLTLVLAAPTVHATGDPIGIDVYPDRAPTTNATARVHLTGYDAGETYNWTVALDANYTIVEMEIHAGFDVTRGRQLVPLLDGKHFIQLTRTNVSDVDRPAKVFNLTRTGPGQWTYTLGLPGPGERNLTLHRDTVDPTVEMGPVRNVTHIGFDVKTTTSEPAMAELVIEGPGIDREPQSTPRPGIWQRFPVQGLDPETTYAFHVRVADWSGNDAVTANETVTTAAAPNPPEPIVEPVSPAPNATMQAGQGMIVEASFDGNGSPIVQEGVRVFFDKEPVDKANLTFQGDRVLYRVDAPSDPRIYFVSVEVPNEAGGIGRAQWSFNVEGTASTADSPLGLEVALAALALAGLAANRWRGKR